MASVKENVAEAATPEQRTGLDSVLKSGSVKVRHGFGFEFPGKMEE